MGWINVKCPSCKKSQPFCYDDFEPGYDKHDYTDVECDHCEQEFDMTIVSENIYIESLVKSEPRDV